MGNYLFCHPKIKNETKTDTEELLKKYSLFESVSSVTQLSLTKTSIQSDLTIKSSVQTNPSEKYSWGRIQTIYLEYTTKTEQRNILDETILKTTEDLFQLLLENVGQVSRDIVDSLVLLDKTFLSRYEYFSIRSHIAPQVQNMRDRILIHVISMLRLHLKILTSLQEKNDQAHEIIQLIAVSHVLMKITPGDFRLMDMSIGKFLIKHEYLNDNNVHAVVIYLNLIADRISECMNSHRGHENLVRNFTVADEPNTTDARVNYRLMKKWKKLIEKIRGEFTFSEVISDTSNSYKCPYENILAMTDDCKTK